MLQFIASPYLLESSNPMDILILKMVNSCYPAVQLYESIPTHEEKMETIRYQNRINDKNNIVQLVTPARATESTSHTVTVRMPLISCQNFQCGHHPKENLRIDLLDQI